MHIVVGLLIAFVLVALLSNRKTRDCRWRADRKRDTDGKSFHICMSCGATCLTANGKPPKHCEKTHPTGPS
jgi:hypothetical protein